VQTQHVVSIVTGRDSGWGPQRRHSAMTAWGEAWSVHWPHVAMGVIIGGIAYLLSPTLVAWLSPTLAGLLLAIPLSKISGSPRAGKVLERLALLRTPEERHVPELMQRRDELVRVAPSIPHEGLRFVARNRQAMLAHITGNLPRPSETRGHPDPHRLTAEQKVMDARSLHEALSWLAPAERVHVAGDARLLERLAELPD
jgi:membrane glycosyltransferase